MECESAFKQVGAVPLNRPQYTRLRTAWAIEVNRYYLMGVVRLDAAAFQQRAQFGEMLMVPGLDRAQNVDR
jgi:hypothetical protein